MQVIERICASDRFLIAPEVACSIDRQTSLAVLALQQFQLLWGERLEIHCTRRSRRSFRPRRSGLSVKLSALFRLFQCRVHGLFQFFLVNALFVLPPEVMVRVRSFSQHLPGFAAGQLFPCAVGGPLREIHYRRDRHVLPRLLYRIDGQRLVSRVCHRAQTVGGCVRKVKHHKGHMVFGHILGPDGCLPREISVFGGCHPVSARHGHVVKHKEIISANHGSCLGGVELGIVSVGRILAGYRGPLSLAHRPGFGIVCHGLGFFFGCLGSLFVSSGFFHLLLKGVLPLGLRFLTGLLRLFPAVFCLVPDVLPLVQIFHLVDHGVDGSRHHFPDQLVENSLVFLGIPSQFIRRRHHAILVDVIRRDSFQFHCFTSLQSSPEHSSWSLRKSRIPHPPCRSSPGSAGAYTSSPWC